MKWTYVFSAAAGVILGSATPPPPAAEGAVGAPAIRLAYADLSIIGDIDVVIAPPTADEKIQWGQLGDVGQAQPCSIDQGLDCAPKRTSREQTAPLSKPLRGTRSAWNADPSYDGPIRVVISLPQQKAFVFQGSELIASSRVSTGRRGHETPVGTFPIMQKKVRHFSNIYDNAPMPYMQRLTSGGVALHAGHVPGYRASHGCIRLPWSFAKKLFGMTRPGTPVVVTNDRVSIS